MDCQGELGPTRFFENEGKEPEPTSLVLFRDTVHLLFTESRNL